MTDHLIACPAMKHLENSISQPCDTEGEIPELSTLIVTGDWRVRERERVSPSSWMDHLYR